MLMVVKHRTQDGWYSGVSLKSGLLKAIFKKRQKPSLFTSTFFSPSLLVDPLPSSLCLKCVCPFSHLWGHSHCDTLTKPDRMDALLIDQHTHACTHTQTHTHTHKCLLHLFQFCQKAFTNRRSTDA